MKINYIKVGDYLLPNLTIKKQNDIINKYGYLRLNYLKKHKKSLYTILLMQDKLNEHLVSVSIETKSKINYLIDELVKSDNTINEKLKAENQMLWVQKMNTCKSIAEEIILKEYIYV